MWQTIERPGYFGKERDEKIRAYDDRFGKGNWKIAWEWNGEAVGFDIACQIYEDGYYADSFQREKLWRELIEKARDVYDIEEQDVKSGLDYRIQKGRATHLQDIAIRRVVLRRGWRFEGDELIQIRSHSTYWGDKLSPGRVRFHLPERIVVPHLEAWWDYDSVEDFYQSNKVIQARV
jgi:hypothetical protein